ncbi:hypothetical protein A3E89_00040 [Candidatus Campbellbacteria bacterium RIFCSPHIGHO2_12_FULL_35_10]|uniref:Uncharacterized protein n=1 Tax=Candidatus Campbellbacteria bacterium RIFCSPHIGHO2_12_FULL_35_10 TaxID=1797578 RepID=A0A1F5EQ57_9BACT|nr:MAG: hypothetical protein A3E89_00040 [Candidatus Campbellbacteria bacterium RIFCSPHIGHO2_12_FULL_35_10]
MPILTDRGKDERMTDNVDCFVIPLRSIPRKDEKPKVFRRRSFALAKLRLRERSDAIHVVRLLKINCQLLIATPSLLNF